MTVAGGWRLPSDQDLLEQETVDREDSVLLLLLFSDS